MSLPSDNINQGIHVLSPQPSYLESRYNLDICKMGKWNHRIEKYVSGHANLFQIELVCSYWSERFPFRNGNAANATADSIFIKGGTTLNIFPRKAATIDTAWTSISSAEDRQRWFKKQSESKGQELSDNLKIKEVEIDTPFRLMHLVPS